MSSVTRNKKTASQNKTNYFNNKLVDEFKPIPGIGIADFIPEIPVGSVVACALLSDPIGWFICDGRAVSRQYYPDLFAAIGDTYGAGDGVLTFNIPDYRGAFLRGAGFHGTYTDYSGNDIGNTPQEHAMQTHSHTITDPGHNHTIPFYNDSTDDQFGGALVSNQNTHFTSNIQTSSVVTGITTTNEGANDGTNGAGNNSAGKTVRYDPKETRPFNYGINWIIRHTGRFY